MDTLVVKLNKQFSADERIKANELRQPGKDAEDYVVGI